MHRSHSRAELTHLHSRLAEPRSAVEFKSMSLTYRIIITTHAAERHSIRLLELS